MPEDASTTNGTTTSTTSDYDLVGGEPAVAAVVDLFYRRVLADASLAGYFGDTDMATLQRHQTALVSQVMGGPAQYSGRTLDLAHRGMGISDRDFDRVVEHLVAALQEAGVPGDVIGRIGEALGATRGDVVTAGASPE